MSAIYIIAAYSNYSGNGLDNYGDYRSLIMRITIANQDQLILLSNNSTI